ncbi:thioredoxin-like protein [Hysterangium stoloniferum]|nr:thioredoxin-like protein [Hysterangium stoloniferum]
MKIQNCNNDALRKHGIIPRRDPTPPTPSPPSSPKLESLLDSASSAELQELEDEALDSDTERMIASYSRKRLDELRATERSARFGEIYPIGREDYTREVTDASKVNEPGESPLPGTGVVCFLYKDGQVASVRLADQLKQLARRHPRTKFVSIVGTKCIQNYADDLCPTLIVYRGGEVTRQVVAWGAEKERTLAELEATLILSLAIVTSSRPLDSSDDRESPDEGSDEEGYRKSSTRILSSSSNSKPSKNLRTGGQTDSDSDFDL